MESLVKADIFFVVTTAVVVLVGILVSIFLIQAIRTAAIIKRTVKSGSEYIEEIQSDLKKQGVLMALFNAFIPKKKKRK